MTIWVVVGPDGKPFKGTAWKSNYSNAIRAFNDETSAKKSARQFENCTVMPFEPRFCFTCPKMPDNINAVEGACCNEPELGDE